MKNKNGIYLSLTILMLMTTFNIYSQKFESNIQFQLNLGLSVTGDGNVDESISDLWPINSDGIPNEEVEVFAFKYSGITPTISFNFNKFFADFPIGLTVQGNVFTYRRNLKKLTKDYFNDPEYEKYEKNPMAYYPTFAMGPIGRFKLKSDLLVHTAILIGIPGNSIKPSYTMKQKDVRFFQRHEYHKEDKGGKIILNAGIIKTIKKNLYYNIRMEYYILKSSFRFERILNEDPNFPLREFSACECVRGSTHGFAPGRSEKLVGLSLSFGLGWNL
ncbi:MAG: hypothetical protein AAGA64_02860 [Bacteroidota bacterium]